ncbi:MAG: succinate dehydrogenase, cytochrome b556 subunit [Methylobacter sp.]|nr:MAG: succinate dehydrogenase, cytochrome b556 subunit [Methylobacter sp.]PPD28581.1 MAG: succinate dehydrogenase, cytochrome b556 subunit [Methylomonas sp.]
MASRPNRPLSPHLQIYRLPLTGIISISHRITGVSLCFGLVLFVAVLSSVADSGFSYGIMQSWFDNLFVKLIYWGFVFALCFHLCHGVRHLIWDAGAGFDKASMDKFALYELAAAVLLTVLVLTFI